MGMKETACSGYVVEAEKLTKLLVTEMRPAYQQALEDLDMGRAAEILNETLGGNLPEVAELFVLSDEDSSDHLDHGTVYAVFDEDELFVMQPTRAFENMKLLRIEPHAANWITFG